jgi:trehalose-phosphatase
VTGRPISDVRRFLDVQELYYVGIHGLEIMLPSESAPTTQGSAMIRSVLPTIKRELEAKLGALEGILIEDKGAALACHYRLASSADAELARESAAKLTLRYQRRGIPIALQHGHAVAEIRPAHVNKGKAVCALLSARAPHALPVYIGDDRTDEDAFRLLPPSAITVHVAPREPTPARYCVSSPTDVHRFLNGLLKARMRGTLAD